MKRTRLRKWAKWACTIAAGATVGLAVFSGFNSTTVVVESRDQTKSRFAQLARGQFEVGCRYGHSTSLDAGRWYWERFGDRGWSWGLADEAFPSGRETGWRAGIQWHPDTSVSTYGVSLVYPILLMTIPAAILWYSDHRRPGRHACKKCNYDRRGLAADAKCPECGTVPALPSK